MSQRAVWARLSDAQLLAQCEVDTYRASGPGGQKRNKTSSAVRLRHTPSGLLVIAEESRSQHEDYRDARTAAGRLDLGRKDPRFWPVAGVVLDVLQALGARVSEAAEALGVSTANLISFLAVEPKVWEQANHLRNRFGHKALRSS